MSGNSEAGGESPRLSSDSSLSSLQQEWDELELEAVEVVRRTETISPPTTRRQAKSTKRSAPAEESGSRKKVKHTKAAVSSQEDVGQSTQTSVSKKNKKQSQRVTAEAISVQVEQATVEVETVTEKKTKKTAKAGGKNQKTLKAKEASQVSGEAEEEESSQKPKRRRKTKEEREAEAMPLAARTVGLRMYIGAHVSSAKGVHNSITNCVHIGGNAFALFLKSQRKWKSPALEPEHATLFKSSCRDHRYDSTSHVLPHGSYLVNLAQKDPDKAEQAYDCFIDDLRRCEELGIRLYNFHPGWVGPHPRNEGIARIASALNRAHRETCTVKTVLETMVGRKVIGSTFEDLRDIIALVEDKSRIGAAGYDLRSRPAFNKTLSQFDQIIGLAYLSALHLNDSKAPFRAERDLHQNIGLGFLGLRAFHNVMNEARLEGLPMVLETPIDRDGKEDKRIWADEIKLLEGLIGMDPESPTFLAKEKELAAQGAQERKKYQEAYEKKLDKERKAAEKKRKKERVTSDEEEEEDEDRAQGDVDGL
ncbi:MAG: hypothetical protein M1816_006386 [Peltula sp. TS41687]|nr:MAG: hypothetical protein M1816_006386 [Peltula sp. TS41687]